MDFRELFVKQKEVTCKRTRSIFPRIPRDKVAWAPVAGALSLGQLLRHIWHSESGVREVVLYDRWHYYERRIPEGLFAILGEVRDVDEEIQSLEKTHQETLELVAKMPLERFEQGLRHFAGNHRARGAPPGATAHVPAHPGHPQSRALRGRPKETGCCHSERLVLSEAEGSEESAFPILRHGKLLQLLHRDRGILLEEARHGDAGLDARLGAD
jgi:hypothetical protein